MNRLFPLVVCVLFVWTKTSAQNTEKFKFQDGRSKTFVIVESEQVPAAKNEKKKWLKIRSEQHPDQEFESSDRIALQIKPGSDVNKIIGKASLELVQQVNETTYVFRASDAESAAREAERLSKNPQVLNSTPVMRSLNVALQMPVAATPNDVLFSSLWHLENPTYPGIDLNIRSAWPLTRGENVTLAIADQAVNVTHPDLLARASSSLHFNFINNSTNLTLTDKDTHATGVAGLAVATMNNSVGIAGLAPLSSFASWRIFATNGGITDDQQLMNMFQYRSNSVAVQNHSWASTSRSLFSPGFLSRMGVEQAVQSGRDGKGVVMVRSAGNRRLGGYESGAYRELSSNANDDGFCTNPDVIVVAAARADGRVTRYSSPGANVLVAGLSNESSLDDTTVISSEFPALTTTASDGSYTNFSGTSGAVPQIAGIASLILSANTNLTYRDVQQILLLSSRHFDLADPDVRTNGAGLRVSHNLGFGIPDAQVASHLATTWNNRPSREFVSLVIEEEKTIPDRGFLVCSTGSNVSAELAAIPAWMPSEARHPDIAPGEMFRPDSPTENLPMVYVGQAISAINENLSGKVALIQRGGGASFFEKVKRAEQAGAAAAIVFNNAGDALVLMNMTNFVSIPCTFIGQTAGDALVAQSQTNASARAQLRLNTATYTFVVTNQLSLEHVGVKIRTDNLRRADIRITLTSPSGTRSILQRVNNDPSTNAPIDWTYISAQHFYESSVGTWTLQLSDEVVGAESFAYFTELQLFGVPIADTDADGLDDNWELAQFGNLNQTAASDPDGDEFSNLKEMLIGTNPLAHNAPIITQQPPYRITKAGSSTFFDVQANGMQPLFFQWKLNGINIAGATQSVLALSNPQNAQQGNYSVEISNIAGSVLSSNAYLGFFTCVFQTAASQTNFVFGGGSGFISVTTSNGCGWDAASANNWLTLTSATNDSGNGLVHFSLEANLGLPRTGTITVAGKTHIINQAGAFLPTQIAGMTFIFTPDGSSGLSERLVVIISPDGTSLRLFTIADTTALEVSSFEYSMDSSGKAFLFFGETEIELTFTSGAAGAFNAINLNNNSYEGTFSMLQSGPDFNGDGRVDLLFHGTNRVVYSWLMNGTNFVESVALRDRLPSGPGWRISGTSDFNGDGKWDVLFQNNGRHAIWFMDGTEYLGVQYLNSVKISVAWNSIALGDFNNDGKDDILFQHANGPLAIWHMDPLNGTNVLSTATLAKNPGSAWRVFAAADFNHDRKTDILFQHTTNGKLAVWYMDGFTFVSSAVLRDGQPAPLIWKAMGSADLNHDGKNDIIFQNAKGALAVWFMDGKDLIGSAVLRNGIPAGTGGRLVGPN